jgi:hypothetical protein
LLKQPTLRFTSDNSAENEEMLKKDLPLRYTWPLDQIYWPGRNGVCWNMLESRTERLLEHVGALVSFRSTGVHTISEFKTAHPKAADLIKR